MGVEDLELKEFLELNPVGGTAHSSGQRALIFDAVSHWLLRKELIDNLGEKTAQGLLARYGYIHGRRLAKTIKNKFKWDSDEDWQKAGVRIYALQGLFTLDSDVSSPFGPEGGTLRDSYEAEQNLLLRGRSDKPVCWNLCGIISGYLSFTTGKELYALEDKCIGKGDPACHLIIKSEEEWGSAVGDELAFFKLIRIDDDLGYFTTTLKRKESESAERSLKRAILAKIEEVPAKLVARSPEMRKLLFSAKIVALTDSPVLITGERGTEQESVARFVHEHSANAAGPFIAVNCGAITETLLESQLFGHAREAFHEATKDHPGLFEAANDGTLFLDEVGEITLPIQLKLLWSLQEKEVRRVGDIKSRPVNVRLISATNKDLTVEVVGKRFREDLYSRLNVAKLAVPPLRQRREDILPLARLLLVQIGLKMKRSVDGLTPTAADKLLGYGWPGNVLELEISMERAVTLAKTNLVDVQDLPPEILAVHDGE
jgi:two-component system response regulator HydG